MGDHRDNSVDSRFPQAAGGIGPGPFENLIGRVDGGLESVGPIQMRVARSRVNLNVAQQLADHAQTLDERQRPGSEV